MHWIGTWTTTPAPVEGLVLSNQTLRMITRVSIGGSIVRVRLSNAYGQRRLDIGSAHVAIRGKDAGIVPGSDRPLTFNGSGSFGVPAGALVVSDPVELGTPPLADLAVSFYLPGNLPETFQITGHGNAHQTSWISPPGDFAAAAEMPVKETTEAFPEVVEAAVGLGARGVLLDGEILAHSGDRVLPFFDLQRRLGRKVVSEKLRSEVPVVFVAFDLLHLDGSTLLERPLRERRGLLEALGLEPPLLLARVERADDAGRLDRIFAETRDRGNEGLMVKDPESAYTPGRRGLAWLKLKRPLATLDCVVTAVEWGHGKRRGVLSDYTFAVLDEDSGKLLNVGKAYTGLTDAEIAAMTRHFLSIQVADHGRALSVRPEVVVEVAFDSIQRSARHRSGFALRFPRIVRLRDDKPVAEIDTLARVAELYDRYYGRGVPLDEVAEVSPS